MLHLREAQKREATINFDEAVLAARQDVADAMTAYTRFQQQRAALAEDEGEDNRTLLAAGDQHGNDARVTRRFVPYDPDLH
jgi:outer membrane protein TolC